MMNSRILLLLVVGMVLMGSVSAVNYVLNMTLLSTVKDNAWPFSIDAPYRLQVVGNFSYITAQTGDGFSIYNISDPKWMKGIGNYTKSTQPNSTDGAIGFYLDFENPLSKIMYVASSVDAGVTAFNVTDPVRPYVLWSTNMSFNPYSLDGAYAIVGFNYSGSKLIAVSSNADFTITILNVTNPLAVTNFTYRFMATGNCSLDGVRRLLYEPSRNILLAPAYNVDRISAFNLSSFPINNITCINSYTKSTSINSTDGPYNLAYDSALNVLITTSEVDSEIVIFNMSNFPAFTPIASIQNTAYNVPGSTRLLEDVTTITRNGTTYLFSVSRSNDTLGFRSHISVYNITKPNAPSLIKGYNTTNGTSCVNQQVRDIELVDDILYYVSMTDDCFYAVRAFDKIESLVTSSCTYSGSGNWVITDRCVISSDVNVCPDKIVVNTTGQLNLTSNAKLTASLFQFYPANTGMVRLGLSKGRLAKC